MAYSRAPFGEGGATGSGNVVRAVNTSFGRRVSGDTAGKFSTDGAMQELVFELNGSMVSAQAFSALAPTIPKSAKVLQVLVEVTEAFVLGGTTPIIRVGTSGGTTANGIQISEAQAEAIGIYDVTSTGAGTWANTAGANLGSSVTTVGINLTGTSPTSTTAGKARVVVRYMKV